MLPMQVTVNLPAVLNLTHIRLELPIKYGDEDIPYDFPLRVGDLWTATVQLDTGKIEEWPQGKAGELFIKVTDGGTYILFDEHGKSVASLEHEYVPHGVVPGEDGDYVSLEIDETGTITNWPKKPNVRQFFVS